MHFPKVFAVLRLIPSVFALLLPAQTSAQSPSDKACQSEEQHQFDFWIGDWEVFLPNGQKAGENRIERIAGGCALLENWVGHGGVFGTSLNFYDRDRGLWHQTWVDNSGEPLILNGSFARPQMVLLSEPIGASGKPVPTRQRITWTPQGDGSVRQHWESSSDNGATWTTAFDGKYVRRR